MLPLEVQAEELSQTRDSSSQGPLGHFGVIYVIPPLSSLEQNCVSADHILILVAVMGGDGHTRLLVFLNRFKHDFNISFLSKKHSVLFRICKTV